MYNSNSHHGLTNWFDKLVLSLITNLLDSPQFSIKLWTGEIINSSPKQPQTQLLIHSRRALYRLCRNPNISFGELYSSGDIEVDGDLIGFMQEIDRIVWASQKKFAWLWQLLWKETLPEGDSISNARQSIHHHYDLGNDFYRLWLDQLSMQYTCAYFTDPEMTLEMAQQAKLAHICRKLRLQAGEQVIEAGGGWGGLALYMAKNYNVHVKSYNISKEQITYAREQAALQQLTQQIEYIEDDYRNITGQCDAFVSVGMLEHVGKRNFSSLTQILDRCLKPNGRGLIHSMGRNKPTPMNPWLTQRIFPGAYAPSLREIVEILEPSNFSVLDVENLRLHYAATLQHWLNRFEEHEADILNKYGKQFVRAWRLYLAASVATFLDGGMQLFQVLFSRSNNNDLALTRKHLYS